MDVLPILHYDDGCDRNRHQHGEGRGHFQRNGKGQQWNGDESFAKAKRRTNQRGDKDDN